MLLPTFGVASTLKQTAIETVVKINNNCSAVAINHNGKLKLLTANHCAKGVGVINFETRNEKREIVSIVESFYTVEKTVVENDLSLLVPRDQTLKISTAIVAEDLLVDEGDQVWTVGYPMNFSRVVTTGLFNQELTAKFINGVEKTRFRASPDIEGGNSGGGMFQYNPKTDKYELIGITSMKMRINNHMGIYTSLSDIRDFLRFVKIDNTHKLDAR